MKKPKREDFEYYQDGLVFKTVNVKKYTEALDLYLEYEKKQLELCEVINLDSV
jgi:hypothetical protein